MAFEINYFERAIARFVYETRKSTRGLRESGRSTHFVCEPLFIFGKSG